MIRGEDIHTDQAGISYDPFDFISEFIIPINDDGAYHYEVYCPTCRKFMYKSNEPCRILPIRPCSKCSKCGGKA
jgi:hypothetical protein